VCIGRVYNTRTAYIGFALLRFGAVPAAAAAAAATGNSSPTTTTTDVYIIYIYKNTGAAAVYYYHYCIVGRYIYTSHGRRFWLPNSYYIIIVKL
jgi:hypothetical protein